MRVSSRVRPLQFSKLARFVREDRGHFGSSSFEEAARLSTSPADSTRDARGSVSPSEPASFPLLHVGLLRHLESALSLRLLTWKTRRRRKGPAEEAQLLKTGCSYLPSHFLFIFNIFLRTLVSGNWCYGYVPEEFALDAFLVSMSEM